MQQVLIIDDHLQVREMTSRVLAGRYALTLREDALDIIADYERLDAPIVLLDIWMPQLDGISAARILKGKHPEAQIVFLSSDPKADTIARAAVFGDGYVVKTRAAADLVPAIQRAIAASADRSGGNQTPI